MSSDLLDNAPYGLKHSNNDDKGDSTNIHFNMERLNIQHSQPYDDGDDDDDDNEIIGNILQSPANSSMSLSSDPATMKNDQQMQQRVQSPSVYTDSNWTTTTFSTNSTTDHEDDDLRQAMQLTWNALDTVLSDDGVKPIPFLGTTQSDGKKRDTAVKPYVPPTEQQQQQQHTSVSSALVESTTIAPASPITTARIYITDFKNYKTVQLTNLLTTAMVIQYLKRKELLDADDDWTMFEIATEHGIERPLRLWEIVSDVTSCWPKLTPNILLIKKYGLHKTLTMDSLLDKTSLVHGWLNIEYKKEKWQKRYCFIKDHIIYHADDSKYSNSAVLCHLGSFDVYTLLQPCSTSPTPFVFALKFQDKLSTFGKDHGYVRLFTAEDQSCLETWVLGIRQEKSILQYRKNPKRVKNPLAVFKPSSTSNPSSLNGQGRDQTTLVQRHKSLKLDVHPTKIDTSHIEQPKSPDPPSSSRRITDAEIKRRMSRRGISRTGTIRHREHQLHPSACDTDNTTNGSKTMTATTTMSPTICTTDEGNSSSSSSNTLIQINDKFKFSKGSLLDKDTAAISTATTSPSLPQQQQQQQQHLNDGKSALSRMSSIRTGHSGDAQQRSRTLSQRRKGCAGGVGHYQQQQQPNTTAETHSSSGKTVSMTSFTSGTTLLNLHHTPERFHTQTLLQRQLKPLLNFNQDIASVPRR